jgi:hypothetical protein
MQDFETFLIVGGLENAYQKHRDTEGEEQEGPYQPILLASSCVAQAKNAEHKAC